ncbi:DUF6597 domain-containing transcriptional factor [Parapedobacter deserti]|uniref:DUF6597 domain-containing transcriptional factor n=1 Tax=Parapedobacter deserti TaxID=1912957 RepID=A0ABV7JQ21_9SPHI
MIYKEIKPHPSLADYIDAYWITEGVEKQCVKDIILPDNCVDLIFNLGEKYETYNGALTMYPEKTYLVGTMTTFKESVMYASNKLIGVRFKPSAFSSFYNFAPSNEIRDKTIEFEQSLSPDIHQIEKHSFAYLDKFFLKGLTKEKHNLFKVVRDIEITNGLISMDILAKQNSTTIRQLERDFRKYVGISPKVFANIVRFRTALFKIKHNRNQLSLLGIAHECGYYDHAHLTNEIKRYAGVVPSKF